MTNISDLIARFNKLRTDRANYETVWQDIADYVLPNRGDFITQRSKGDNTNARLIFDTTGLHANELLAATLHGGLTNPATKWLGLKLSDTSLATEEVNRWLEFAGDKLLEVFNSSSSNFPSQNHEFLLSLTSLGTACMLVEESDDQIRFSTVHLSEIYVMEDKNSVIDTIFRKFKFTARQAAQFFGEDALHIKMREALQKEPDMMFDILHVVMPRIDAGKSKRATDLPFASLYLDATNIHLIKEGGFNELAYIVARFSKLIGEKYGRSPAWNSLPDIKMVSKMNETIIKAAQLQTTPPLMVSDDGVMLPLRTTPNALIMGGLAHDGTERVRPLNIGGNLQLGDAIVSKFEKKIRDMFFIDQLIFRDGPAITATEAIQRQDERLRLLSPHLGRIQAEYLTPLINRVMGLLFRAGKLGEIPDVLSGSNLEVEYLSPLAKLSKSQDISAIQRTLGIVAPIAELNPEVLDNFDFDKMAKQAAESSGIPLTILRTEEEKAAIRAERQQAQQAQQALQEAQQLSEISKNIPEGV